MTNDITLDDARLAAIEKAAKDLARAIWDQNDPQRNEVIGFVDYGFAEFGILGEHYFTAALTTRPSTAAHIVATQPRVALALIAEIRRLRAEVAALRGEGAK